MGNKLPTLIEPESLDNLIKEPDFDKKNRIIEVHLGPGARGDYEASHIKNALFFDTFSCFEPTKLFPKDWPKPDKFAEYLGDMGISNKHNVIIYDRTQYGFAAASRVWLHLRAFGNQNVSILNGGLNAWKSKNFELTNEIRTFPKVEFKIKENKTLVKNYDDIVRCLSTKSAQLVDVRTAEEYNKENQVLGQNFIPSSKNFPFPELFNPDTGKIKEKAQIIEMFQKAGINLSGQVILYCNTSVTASIVAFAAFLIGHENIPVYKGSWIEYSQRKEEEVKNQSE